MNRLTCKLCYTLVSSSGKGRRQNTQRGAHKFCTALRLCFQSEVLLRRSAHTRRFALGGEGDTYSQESIDVTPNFLHGIDSGSSHLSARMYYLSVMLLVCAMSVSIHTAQTLRFMLTGVIGLRFLLPQKQVDQSNAYAGP